MIFKNKMKTYASKGMSVIVALALSASMLPVLNFKQEAFAEEQGSAETSTFELTDESVQGRIKSQEEIEEAYSYGGNVNLVDKSDIRYNVKDTDSSDNASLSADSLPTSVDLRTTGTVTSVKNQNKTGTCWAWSANAAAETSIAKATGKNAVDLSAFQTAWMGYEPLPSSTSQLSGTEVSQKGEGAYVINENQTDAEQSKNSSRYRLNCGGNSITSSGLMMQGVGVTTASDIPFPAYALSGSIVKSSDKLTFAQRKHTVARLSKQNELGSLINTKTDSKGTRTFVSTNSTVLKRIKTQLAQGYAVKISYWGGQSDKTQPPATTYYNSEHHSVCTIQPNNMFLGSNHAVCIVGYDDHYSKDNFNAGYQPEGDGAFIVKNSWGTDWGDNGYFYLSYYDQSVDDASTYEFDTTSYTGSLLDTNSEIVDQYDYLQGALMACTSAKWYSNIYTATQRQQLHNIGTYYAPNVKTLTYKVYKLKSNATSPKDIVGSFDKPAAQGTYHSDYEGYVSIKMGCSVTLEKGQKYAIWISQQTNTGTYSVPVTCQANGVSNIGSKAVVNSGESFCTNTPESSWEDESSEKKSSVVSMDNFCVKGYATVLNPVLSRLYNKWTGEHFYTDDISEKENLLSLGWTDEGTGWTSPSTSNTPVYRLYNKYVAGGDHHYTTSTSERDTLIKAGWTYEGISWYSDDNKQVPVYRQYNPFAATGTHNYTTSKAENDNLVSLKWRAEGIAWYGLKG